MQNLPQLTHLGLGHTKVTDAGMQIVAKLTKLESLKLDSANIGDAAIELSSNLLAIRVLGLSNTRITDRAAPMLAKFTKLQ